MVKKRTMYMIIHTCKLNKKKLIVCHLHSDLDLIIIDHLPSNTTTDELRELVINIKNKFNINIKEFTVDDAIIYCGTTLNELMDWKEIDKAKLNND